MNTRPIVAAPLVATEDAADWARPHHIFLAANDLPARWHGRARFVVLETGFGVGSNFLATWQAWQDDAAHCERLVFISIEPQPCSAADMRRAHARSPSPVLASALVDAWPALTHNLHTLDFEGGRVRLLLALGEVRAWLPELVAEVDAFYLDDFAAPRDPVWEPQLFKALARLAAPNATLAASASTIEVHDGLRSAGFETQAMNGTHDMTAARYAPHFTPRRAPSRAGSASTQGHALIVGAGLAGSATALALATEGWRSTVYDRRAAPASETSGNPAGLFHGIVNAQDGTHARFNRAAALTARQAIGKALEDPSVAGAVDGLLRLDESDASALHDVIARLGLPSDYVQAVDATQASTVSGLPLRQAAWFYPGGGWVDPAALACSWLAQAAPFARFQGGVAAARLQRNGRAWQLLDERGRVLDEAETVVLANATDAMRLLGRPGWPIDTVRGQITCFPREFAPSLLLPRVPVAGAGYVLPEVKGIALFGATSHAGDDDPEVRLNDNATNLALLQGLTGSASAAVALEHLQGRVGWRTSAQDRLPVVGAVPAPIDQQGRVDQPRFVRREPGLFVFTALGSRGITWSTLGARALASWITGIPAPLEASLLDAIDPARFLSRSARRPATGAAAHTPEGD